MAARPKASPNSPRLPRAASGGFARTCGRRSHPPACSRRSDGGADPPPLIPVHGVGCPRIPASCVGGLRSRALRYRITMMRVFPCCCEFSHRPRSMPARCCASARLFSGAAARRQRAGRPAGSGGPSFRETRHHEEHPAFGLGAGGHGVLGAGRVAGQRAPSARDHRARPRVRAFPRPKGEAGNGGSSVTVV
jgi:hypothetical protein